MNTERMELITLAFGKEHDAADALAVLQQLESDGSIEIGDATMLSKNAKGQAYIE